MAVDDLWFSRAKKGPDGKPLPLKRHGRGKRWRVRNIGYSDVHFDKRSDADKLDAEREGRIVAGKLPLSREAGTALVKDYVVRTLEVECGAGEITRSSFKQYMSAARRVVFPFFGDMTIREANPGTIRDWKAWVALQRTRKGTPHADSTVNLAWVVIGKTFRHAIDNGGIERHPMEGVDRVAKPGPKPVTPWEDSRVAALLAHVSPAALGPVTMAYTCGTRPAESLALSIQDFHARPGKVRIRHQILRDVGLAPVKGGTQVERYVPLPGWTADVVERIVSAPGFKPVRVVCECHGEPNDVIFLRKGRLWSYRDFTRYEWLPAMTAAGLLAPVVESAPAAPRRYSITDAAVLRLVGPEDEGADEVGHKSGMHQLRHYYASSEIREGVGIVEVSKRLGHKEIQTTHAYYAHLFAQQDDDAASRGTERARRLARMAAGEDVARVDGVAG